MLSSARLTGQTLGAVVLATIFTFAGGHGGHAEIVALAVAGCFAAMAGVFHPLRGRTAPLPKPRTGPQMALKFHVSAPPRPLINPGRPSPAILGPALPLSNKQYR